MQVAPLPDNSGVLVWLDPDECDCYRKLVADAEKAGLAGPGPRATLDYVGLSLMLGKLLNVLMCESDQADDPATIETAVDEVSGLWRR